MKMRICSVVMVCVCWLLVKRLQSTAAATGSAAGSVVFGPAAQSCVAAALCAQVTAVDRFVGLEPNLGYEPIARLPPGCRCAEPRAAMPCGCEWRIRRKGNEPVGTCTLLSRLKGGGFALKASGSQNGSRGRGGGGE